MTRVCRAALVLVSLLSCAAPAVALDPSRRIDLYALDVWREGLPQYTVQAIDQGPQGYLWLGTFEGLVRFDGIRFDVFDETTVPSIENWQVRAICHDRNGILWVGTGRGLVSRHNGIFSLFPGPLQTDTITSLLPAKDGSLWVGTDRGIFRIRDGVAETLDGLPDRVVAAIAEERDGTIVAGTEGGIARFDGKRFREVALDALPDRTRITALMVARDGALWVGTFADGLLRIKGDREERFAGQSWVTTILEDRDHSIWFGTQPGGLSRISNGRTQFLGRERGLPNDSVRRIFEDREGSLWVGTNAGLARLKDLKFVNWSRRNGLSEDNIRVVTETDDGSMWIGTTGGGVDRILDDKVSTFLEPGPFVRTLAATGDGIWVGSADGLARIGFDGRVKKIEAFAGKKINALAVRRDGSLLVADDSRGLVSLRDGREKVLAPGAPVRVLLEDRGGHVWAGTPNQGLFELVDGALIRRWNASSAIYAIQEEPDGSLWMGTRKGLARYRDGEVDEIRSLGPIFQLIDDGIGGLWLTSSHGLRRVDRAAVEAALDGRNRQLQTRTFSRADGMGSEQCNGNSQPAGIRLRDGNLAIPTAGGLTIVDPRHLHFNSVPPPVVLTKVVADGRNVTGRNGLTLPWNSSRVEFHFDGLSLLQPAMVNFRYRLDGFDREWIESDGRRVAMYNSLPPGPHVFRVIALNNDGVPSTEEATFGFDLPKPPWLRWWALVAYALLATLLVLAVIRLRERALHNRNRILEEKVQERTAALDLANQQLAQLSITDSLTQVANRRRFDQMLDLEWSRARRAAAPLSLLVIDIDEFKAYNDTYGHLAGDDCLKEVAAAMRGVLSRSSDLVARWGGDEFVVLLPGSTEVEATLNAERIRTAVQQLALTHPHTSIGGIVRVSVGVATMVPVEGTSPEDLIRAADAALYRTKRTESVFSQLSES
ncbi:MAG: diguanylate cyclase [Thermoanaerobaculia bacterium]